MKEKINSLVFLILLLLLGVVIWQGEVSLSLGKEKTLTVTGVGKIKMKPEAARFTAGVQKFAADINEAMSQEKQATKAIIDTLKEAGIKEEDIKTTNFSVWPQTSDYYENNVRRTQISGYSVYNNIEVKITMVDRVSEILGKVIAAGANNVSGVSFGADDPTEQEALAREKAIQDAQEKAQKMAQAAGRKLGKIISLAESYSSYMPYKMDGGGGGGGGPAIETGGLEVAQTVTVVFALN